MTQVDKWLKNWRTNFDWVIKVKAKDNFNYFPFRVFLWHVFCHPFLCDEILKGFFSHPPTFYDSLHKVMARDIENGGIFIRNVCSYSEDEERVKTHIWSRGVRRIILCKVSLIPLKLFYHPSLWFLFSFQV